MSRVQTGPRGGGEYGPRKVGKRNQKGKEKKEIFIRRKPNVESGNRRWRVWWGRVRTKN